MGVFFCSAVVVGVDCHHACIDYFRNCVHMAGGKIYQWENWHIWSWAKVVSCPISATGCSEVAVEGLSHYSLATVVFIEMFFPMGKTFFVWYTFCMKYIHYSRKHNISLDPTMEYKQRVGFKPRGLWFCSKLDLYDVGWEDWCRWNQFSLEGLKYRYEIELESDANIFLCTSIADLYNFTADYAVDDGSGPYDRSIDWQKVAKACDGIIVAPYQKKIRDHPKLYWHYSWDCSSGCVWNMKAVKKFSTCGK